VKRERRRKREKEEHKQRVADALIEMEKQKKAKEKQRLQQEAKQQAIEKSHANYKFVFEDFPSEIRDIIYEYALIKKPGKKCALLQGCQIQHGAARSCDKDILQDK
jgi:lysine/ornithine N-monooxygenase